MSYYHSHTPEYQTDYLRGVWREILRLRAWSSIPINLPGHRSRTPRRLLSPSGDGAADAIPLPSPRVLAFGR